MTTTSKTAAPEFTELPMDKVLPHPRNVRRRLTGIDELAASLKAEGLHQPLVVAPQDDGYVVVMGNRRRAAAESLGWETVPCMVRHDLDTEAAVLTAMLAENCARSELSVTEEGDAVQRLLDLDVTPTAIAKRIGRSKKTVSDRARVAGLSERVRVAVDDQQMSIGDALALAEIEGSNDYQAVEAAIGTPNFRYQLERARAQVKYTAARQKKIDELVARGATCTGETTPTPEDGKVIELLDGEPEDVTEDGVAFHIDARMMFYGGAEPRVRVAWHRTRDREEADGHNRIVVARDGDASSSSPGGDTAAAELRRQQIDEKNRRAAEDRERYAAAGRARIAWLRDFLADPPLRKTHIERVTANLLYELTTDEDVAGTLDDWELQPSSSDSLLRLAALTWLAYGNHEVMTFGERGIHSYAAERYLSSLDTMTSLLGYEQSDVDLELRRLAEAELE